MTCDVATRRADSEYSHLHHIASHGITSMAQILQVGARQRISVAPRAMMTRANRARDFGGAASPAPPRNKEQTFKAYKCIKHND